MKKIRFSVAAFFAVLLMVVATSVGAKAGHDGGKAAVLIGPDSFGLFIDKGHGRKGHGYKKYKYYGHKSGYWYKGHRGNKGNGYYGKKRHKGGYGHGHGQKGGYGHKAYYGKKHHGGHGHYRKACHPVYKYGYHNGYRAKIGGTMCYDKYGDGYVVRGSRYVVEYY